jgi:hypothetical protein
MTKKMKIKIGITSTILILMFSLLAGCGENNTATNNEPEKVQFFSPFANIKAPSEAFFGENIDFDATESYDTDGDIVSYQWDFQDGKTSDEKKVTHTYVFDNNYDIEYPLIYTVVLCVRDNDGLVKIANHQIKLFPDEFLFYLKSEEIQTAKPDASEETIKSSGFLQLDSEEGCVYEFEDLLIVDNCNWNAVIYIEKPLLTKINNLEIGFFDDQGNRIINEKKTFGLDTFWREKKIAFAGEIEQQLVIKTIKISASGLSLFDKIKILYGGSNPSSIKFDFKD